MVPQEKMSEFNEIYVEIIFNATGSGMDPITFFNRIITTTTTTTTSLNRSTRQEQTMAAGANARNWA